MTTLLPCHACGRHVKSCEPSCPFCGAARSCEEAAPRVEPTGVRLAAVVAVSAAIGVTACSSSSSGPVAQPMYGGVGMTDSGLPADAGSDVPTAQPAYGVVMPPVDGGSE